MSRFYLTISHLFYIFFSMRYLLLLILVFAQYAFSLELGVDQLFSSPDIDRLKGKRVGLITNPTGVNSSLVSTMTLFTQSKKVNLVALFSPEHGINGSAYAGAHVNSDIEAPTPIYSLHGKTRRPTDEMLKGIDLLVFDIQDIGVRSYTYASTLFYCMEEAAKRGIEVWVLDRPNPMSGHLVDGPILDEKSWRTFVGYVNVPYCHGMTIGELATYFNIEYKVNCQLKVVKMKGWKRSMSFDETGLTWIPTSPHVPEAVTPLYAATTGILGELGIVSIGIGYTLPFKLVGAPWIDGVKMAQFLNSQGLKGVHFAPIYYSPFYGAYKGENCQGVQIHIQEVKGYEPLSVQFLILGALKSLYPKEVANKLKGAPQGRKDFFCKVVGNSSFLKIFENEKFIAWKLIELSRKECQSFLDKRKRYLFPEYE